MLHLMKRGPIVFCLIASKYSFTLLQLDFYPFWRKGPAVFAHENTEITEFSGFVTSFVVSVISPLSVFLHLQYLQQQIKREVQ